MHRSSSTTAKAPPYLIALVALLLACAFPCQAAGTPSASATTTIGITKRPALLVNKLDNGDLYRDSVDNKLSTRICLMAQGQALAYRVSARSLSESSGFFLREQHSGEQIPYAVYWSDAGGLHRLSEQSDVSQLIQLTARPGCQIRTLSVSIDDAAYRSAQSGHYTDTLSILFIIE